MILYDKHKIEVKNISERNDDEFYDDIKEKFRSNFQDSKNKLGSENKSKRNIIHQTIFIK